MASVRYIVDDIDESVSFYRDRLGFDLCGEHIHRNVEQDSSGLAGLRHVQRARHDIWQKLRIVDAPDPFADRAEDIAL